MIVSLYGYAVAVLRGAESQGKPEFALNEVEQRCLRYLKSFNTNFTPEAPTTLEH